MIEGAHTAPPGRLIALGEIVGTHGVRGLLRFHPANEDSAASAVAAAGQTVFVQPARTRSARPDAPLSAPRPITLLSARPHGRMVLLEVEGIADVERATELVGLALARPASELPPPAADEYYTYQLEGLEVVTVDGRVLGTVASVLPTGSNDVLTVRGDAGEHLIPVIKDVVQQVDLGAGRVTIAPMAGLLEEDG